MKFVGENTLRLNRETVMRALVESFSRDLIGNDLEGVSMTYHSNGDVSLVVRQKRKLEIAQRPVRTYVENPAPDAAAPVVPSGICGNAVVTR